LPPPAPDEAGTIDLVIGGLDRADGTALCDRVRALLEGSQADLVICDVSALTHPDAGTVDVLARMQLTARRLGCEIRLRHASLELRELLALVGLRDIVPCPAGSGLEASGQAEDREEPRGVEEERDPADPIP
jgi:ABC-type transporter Mla MlaB component